jgi:hypothetical protein
VNHSQSPALACKFNEQGKAMPYETIRKAIVDRASLTAHYDHYVRFFSPHALGARQDGGKAVLVYQYAGGKPGGLRPSGEWACFDISGITSIARNADTWQRGDSLPRPRCIKQVEVAAEATHRA